MALDHTHDPKRRSWVESANREHADFPLQNLPLGSFRRKGTNDAPRGGVAIGDRLLDLAAVEAQFSGAAAEAAAAARGPSLNRLLAMGNGASLALRRALSELLGAEKDGLEQRRAALEPHLVPIADAELLLPVEIGDYTDFYTSIYHATNSGRALRPDNPLLPNFKYMPVAYHGRASSVVASGRAFKRPQGQIKPGNAEMPLHSVSRALDFEVELGFYIGAGNALGETIAAAAAADHIFGFCLLNDWSARDIQGWEGQPLGPFLGKSFCTTVSPWIVTQAALEPFHVPAFPRAAGDPAPLPYLDVKGEGGLDIAIEALLATPAHAEPMRIALCNARNTYWTVAQMVTHHAGNGCNLRPGDLFGTGTLSGPDVGTLGCFLEATKRGSEPISLPSGETRRWIEDGDEVIFRSRAERAGHVGIGFGECRGRVLPAG